MIRICLVLDVLQLGVVSSGNREDAYSMQDRITVLYTESISRALNFLYSFNYITESYWLLKT